MTTERIAAALEALHKAERELANAVRQELPKGTAVKWERPAGQEQTGVVCRLSSSGLRAEVLNVRTGARYWMRASELLPTRANSVSDT